MRLSEHRLPLVFTGLLLSLVARAEIYRCEQAGRVTFTDHACTAGAAALDLQAPTTVAPAAAPDLGRAYEQRRERERRSRDAADRAFLQRHQADRDEAARIARALAEQRVVPGMNPAQVRQVWGAPDQVLPRPNADGERWIYRQGRGRRSVDFRDGQVAGPSVAPASRQHQRPERR